MRTRCGGHEPPKKESFRLGHDTVARVITRVPHSAVEEPRAALVHRGPGRVRNHHRAAGMGAREQDPDLYQALRAGRLPAVANTDSRLHACRRIE